MSNYRFEVMHPYTVIKQWDELLPHIERVVAIGHGEFSADSIRKRIMNNMGLMVAVYEGDTIIAVNTAEIVTYDSGLKSLLVPIFAGDGLRKWGVEWLELHKEMAQEFGCSEVRGLAIRDGWIRLLKDYGFVETYAVITMPVGEK
jgi:hypothetical protein